MNIQADDDDFGEGPAGDVEDNEAAETSGHQAFTQGAPRYVVPHRDLAAVEFPAVIQDVDRAVKTFGRLPTLQHVSLDLEIFASHNLDAEYT